MSHRVIQVDSKVSSESQADHLQKDVQSKLDSKGYDLHTREVNDGVDLKNQATLGIKTDHNNSTEANGFYSWLWNWAQTNQATFDTNGNIETEGFTRFRIQVHDCKHLTLLDESEFIDKIVDRYEDPETGESISRSEVVNLVESYEYVAPDYHEPCEIGNADKFDLR